MPVAQNVHWLQWAMLPPAQPCTPKRNPNPKPLPNPVLVACPVPRGCIFALLGLLSGCVAQVEPPATALALEAEALPTTTVGPTHPPGLYGTAHVAADDEQFELLSESHHARVVRVTGGAERARKGPKITLTTPYPFDSFRVFVSVVRSRGEKV